MSSTTTYYNTDLTRNRSVLAYNSIYKLMFTYKFRIGQNKAFDQLIHYFFRQINQFLHSHINPF